MQLRNLVLSAFSRDMKLPDPFTPNLRIELLPEISQAPVFLPSAEALLPPQLKCASNTLPRVNSVVWVQGSGGCYNIMVVIQSRLRVAI